MKFYNTIIKVIAPLEKEKTERKALLLFNTAHYQIFIESFCACRLINKNKE